MEEYSSKRTGNAVVASRKSSSLLLRDTANDGDGNAQFCNRIGCRGRLNYAKGTHISCSEREKSSRQSFRASSAGKETTGSSSRTYSPIISSRKFSADSRKKLPSQPETDSSETNSVQDEPQERLHVNPDLPTPTEVGSSGESTSTRSRTSFHQNSRVSAVVPSPSSLTWKRASHERRGGVNKFGLKNIGYNSTSDVVPSGSSSSSVSKYNRKKDVVEKRNLDGESSSSTKGKKLSGLGNSSSNSGISISDSRRGRSGLVIRENGTSSLRTRRSLAGFSCTREANQGGVISTSSSDSSGSIVPELSRPGTPIDLNAPISPHWFSVETSSSHSSSSSFSRPGSSRENFRNFVRPSSPAGIGGARSLINRESFRQYNLDGIAEVLLALERIEQDEELTYEQLLVLETNLFLNGLNFHDQHRDMRLDIDNMSYEELLALEERMGTVSTALTEEALSECLKTSIYRSKPRDGAIAMLGGDKGDTKCSICQEEYADGDEVGRLQCEHRYHVACVHQWLRFKNWCPICKASAAPSSTSTSTSSQSS